MMHSYREREVLGRTTWKEVERVSLCVAMDWMIWKSRITVGLMARVIRRDYHDHIKGHVVWVDCLS